jgi:hypothetical protein
VGIVKRWVLRGLWRRLVGVGIIGLGLLGAPAFIMLLVASSPILLEARPFSCSAPLQRPWHSPTPVCLMYR